MITAAEYRTWAEESLKWAAEATSAIERDAFIKSAETWLESALRSERLSKEPIPITEYEWVLPPFNNGGARALHSNEKAFSANFARVPSCSPKTRRGGSRSTSPSCPTYCERLEARAVILVRSIPHMAKCVIAWDRSETRVSKLVP
jgi:hypothetical protein